MDQPRVSDDQWCFACGVENPHGLHLEFRWEDDDYVCDFVPQKVHQGWAGFTHGGIISTLLDEVMTRMLCTDERAVMTAELKVRFRNPAQVGAPVQLRARAVSQRLHLYQAEAEALLADGTVVATATAKLMQVEGDMAADDRAVSSPSP